MLFRSLSNQWAIEVSTFQRALFDTVTASSVTMNIPVVGQSLGAATWSNSASLIGDQSAFVTFGNQHSYPGGSYPSKDVTNSLTVLKPVFGTKPQYATETGYHNMTTYDPRLQQGVSERASGKYMSRLFFEYFNRGLVRSVLRTRRCWRRSSTEEVSQPEHGPYRMCHSSDSCRQ